MLYPAKLITPVVAAENLAAATTRNNGPHHDSFGCSLILPTQQEPISIGSTVRISWSVQPDALDTNNVSSSIDIDLMRDRHGQNNVVDVVKQNLNSTSRSTLWYINSSLPVADDYYLRISSKSAMRCYGPNFAIQEFHGEDLTNRTSNSLVDTPMVEQPGGLWKENRITRNLVASKSQKVDTNLSNLVAGLLVFGAFLWV